MARTPLSMEPTGWFQVAWSPEIAVGDVHTMKYFSRDGRVALRVGKGVGFRRVLRASRCPPGPRRPRRGENLVCPFHGWEWNNQGRNVCIPEKHPNRGRRIRSYPTVERNRAVWIWFDVDGRPPLPEVPTCSPTSTTTRPPTTTTSPIPLPPSFRPGLAIHPVRDGERCRLRALQVRAQDTVHARVHPSRLRRPRLASISRSRSRKVRRWSRPPAASNPSTPGSAAR